MVCDALSYLSGLYATEAAAGNALLEKCDNDEAEISPGNQPFPVGDASLRQEDSSRLLEGRIAKTVDGSRSAQEPQAGCKAGFFMDYWEQIDEEASRYLLGPREHPSPCAWCGGRLGHNPLCVTKTWEPTLSFGKHKGKKVSETPVDYLRWLIKNSVRLDQELRSEIERRLHRECDDRCGW